MLTIMAQQRVGTTKVVKPFDVPIGSQLWCWVLVTVLCFSGCHLMGLMDLSKKSHRVVK